MGVSEEKIQINHSVYFDKKKKKLKIKCPRASLKELNGYLIFGFNAFSLRCKIPERSVKSKYVNM